MGWPEGIYLALVFLGWCHALSTAGKPREPLDLGVALFAQGLIFGLLWWGCFFQ
jgi:hypothetical protein